MTKQASRIDQISDKDKLWELYLHILAGMHGNVGVNTFSKEKIARVAFDFSVASLKIWKEKCGGCDGEL